MRLFGSALVATVLLTAPCLLATPCLAIDAKMAASLAKLDPDTRLGQVCDLEAMSRISKDKNGLKPDRATTDAISTPKITGDTLQGSGGAVRSGKNWYQFSFTCKSTSDRMSVLSFDYKLGGQIAPEKWSRYGLY